MSAALPQLLLRDKANAKLKIIALTRAYEQRISLEAIYKQANAARLDAAYSRKLLLAMTQTLKEPERYLYANG